MPKVHTMPCSERSRRRRARYNYHCYKEIFSDQVPSAPIVSVENHVLPMWHMWH